MLQPQQYVRFSLLLNNVNVDMQRPSLLNGLSDIDDVGNFNEQKIPCDFNEQIYDHNGAQLGIVQTISKIFKITFLYG